MANEPQSRRAAEPLRENDLTDKIIGRAIEVHRTLGPGLLESAYEECLCHELSIGGLSFKRQVHVPVNYKGIKLDCSYKLDIIVEDMVIIEIKTVERLQKIHLAQLLTYLRLLNKSVGVLINFNEAVLIRGIKRVVNNFNDEC